MNREVAFYAFLVGSYFGYNTQFLNGDINDKVINYDQQVKVLLEKVRRINPEGDKSVETVNKMGK